GRGDRLPGRVGEDHARLTARREHRDGGAPAGEPLREGDGAVVGDVRFTRAQAAGETLGRARPGVYRVQVLDGLELLVHLGAREDDALAGPAAIDRDGALPEAVRDVAVL